MKYFLYILLLYIALPFNFTIDLITILIFFMIFSEDEKFAIIFAFFAGLLIDLYNPVYLGLNMLVNTLLTQLLIYLKRYVAQRPIIILANFTIFYSAKIVITHLALAAPLKIQPIVITTIVFLPLFLSLNRVIHGVWMKI